MYEEVKESIIAHEGKVNMIYKDHLGNGTFGIGHLVLESDDIQSGVAYDDDKVMEIFEKDFQIALDDARSIIDEESIPKEAFSILIEMCFQLGKPRVLKFKRFLYHLNKCEFLEAADEMEDSKWCKVDTPKRAKSLAERMRNI
jgi:lysozyme